MLMCATASIHSRGVSPRLMPRSNSSMSLGISSNKASSASLSGGGGALDASLRLRPHICGTLAIDAAKARAPGAGTVVIIPRLRLHAAAAVDLQHVAGEEGGLVGSE